MGNNTTDASLQNGNNETKQPHSNPGSQLFFNQKPIDPSSKPQETKKPPEIQQPAQEIKLETTTDFLLAAILQELKKQTMIEVAKLKVQQEKEQEELEEAEKMKEQDDARFEEIRQTMYA